MILEVILGFCILSTTLLLFQQKRKYKRLKKEIEDSESGEIWDPKKWMPDKESHSKLEEEIENAPLEPTMLSSKKPSQYAIDNSPQSEYSKDPTKEGMRGVRENLSDARQRMPTPKSLKEKIGTMLKNVKNIAYNGFDNTVGLPIALYQNHKTKKHFKKNPNSKDPLTYLMHGLGQNRGSQWRRARDLRKRGMHAYHLKGNHDLGNKGSTDEAFDQIEEFHEDTGLERKSKGHYRAFSGHSSGGNTGISMASDKRIKKYGINHVQAVAPTPAGFEKLRTAEVKAAGIIINVDHEDTRKSKPARKEAIRLHREKPNVPVYVVSGEHDALVPPDDAVYKHAKGYKVLKGEHTTHFGTSGVNEKANKELNELLTDKSGYRPTEWYKPKTGSVKEHKRDFLGRDEHGRKELQKWEQNKKKYQGEKPVVEYEVKKQKKAA